MMGLQIDFRTLNAVALQSRYLLLSSWLPGGKIQGDEWVARNPTRPDRHPGSFKVNLETGKWADFARSDARGTDLVSLYAYIRNIRQVEAARELARELGVRID